VSKDDTAPAGRLQGTRPQAPRCYGQEVWNLWIHNSIPAGIRLGSNVIVSSSISIRVPPSTPTGKEHRFGKALPCFSIVPLEREDTRSSLLSTSERMRHHGTDEQTDRETNGDSHELLRNAESLTVRRLRVGCARLRGEAAISACTCIICHATHLKIPPLDKPDGSWKRMPATVTGKLDPFVKRPYMLPSVPTVKEPIAEVISDRFGNARPEKWLAAHPAQAIKTMTGCASASAYSLLGLWHSPAPWRTEAADFA